MGRNPSISAVFGRSTRRRREAVVVFLAVSLLDDAGAIVAEPLPMLAITASFGVSGAEGDEIDFERLYHRADQALYEAKRAGRVSVSGAPTAAR